MHTFFIVSSPKGLFRINTYLKALHLTDYNTQPCVDQLLGLTSYREPWLETPFRPHKQVHASGDVEVQMHWKMKKKGFTRIMNEWMNEESWMRGQQMCPLTIHFFNIWTRYKIYNITRYNGERSLLKSERKERGTEIRRKEKREQKMIKIKKLFFHLWLMNSCRIYKEPLYIEVGDPS